MIGKMRCSGSGLYSIVEVSASPTFFGWVFGFGGKISILSPNDIKETYKEQVKQVLDGLED